MDIFKRTFAVLLLCSLGSAVTAQTTNSRFQEAMTLHQIRMDYANFCESILDSASASGHLVPSAATNYDSLHKHVKTCIDNIVTYKSQGSVAPTGNISFNDRAGTNPGASGKSAIDEAARKRLRSKVIEEWHYIEAFVMGSDAKVQENAVLDLSNPSLNDHFPSSFTYLNDIAGQVSGNSNTVAHQTSGGLSALAGGIPEAEIIQGIVDWAIQRAKEELMQAFLQGWLDDINQNPVLQVTFPNTLSLLSSSDLTTIFSQGDTWKAAFKQDLDAIPANLPAIVKAILGDLPRKLQPEAEREIVGGVNVASQLYVQLDRNQNNFRDAITLISQSLMRQTDTLAYSERAVIGSEVLISSVITVKNDLPATVTPTAILNLGASELGDFWNVIFLHNKAELQRALDIQNPKKLYNEVAKELQQLQLILARTADIVENIHDILSLESPNSNAGGITSSSSKSDSKSSITFQEASAYYELVFEMLNNSLDLATLVGKPTGNVQTVLNDVVQPMGQNIMDIAQGVATQQYGEVINSGIKLLNLLSQQVVRDPEVKAALIAATDVLELVNDFRNDLKNQSGSGTALKKQATDLLTNWIKGQGAALDQDLKELLLDAIKDINDDAESDLEAARTFLKSEFKDLKKKLADYIDDLDLGKGIDELAGLFNKYGTLMVNILSASDSDGVKEALEEAAAPTGSYMVKQTSTSSISVSFFPGVAFGHEFANPNRDLVASGGDTLGHSNGNFIAATLPLGIEMAFGLRTRVIGSVGIFAQVADLGTVLSFRLKQPGDSVQVSPDLTFKNVLAPGIGVVLHLTNVPIAVGGRLSYSPQLRSISDGNASYGLNMMQVGGFVAVDLTVFQIFASRRKIATNSRTYGDRSK